MGSGRQLFYESLQYRHTQKPIALLRDSKRDQVSPVNTKIRIRFIIGFCHFPPKNKIPGKLRFFVSFLEFLTIFQLLELDSGKWVFGYTESIFPVLACINSIASIVCF